MKFRFYIATEDGDVIGTDDPVVADQYADNYTVIDSEEGEQVNGAGVLNTPINAQTLYQF